MGRYIVNMCWSILFMSIVGFIAAPLTQNVYVPAEAAIAGAIFGLLFTAIMPAITRHSHQDDSKFSK